MTSPSDVVREFCSAFATKDLATIERLLDDNAVYHNVGMEPAVGKEASIASIKGFLDMSESLGLRDPPPRGRRRHRAHRTHRHLDGQRHRRARSR